MSKILFDNSTLSSVQRLCGSIEAPSSYDPQGDYSALENFIRSIIFNDEYFFIDDYKQERREGRRRSFPYIKALSPEGFPYEDIEKEAASLTKNFVLDIRGGKLTEGVVGDFLKNIGLYLTCAWHMRSSDFFLTLKILAKENDGWEARYKYSPLTAMIFNQLNGIAVGNESQFQMNLISSDGKSIEEEKNEKMASYYFDGQLKNFSNSLNWLALRASFYAILGTSFGCNVCLHPIRHNFLAGWLSEQGGVAFSDGWRRNMANFFANKAADTVNAVSVGVGSVEYGEKLPLFAAWAVGKTGSVPDAIKFVMDFRQSKEIIEIRKRFSEIDEMIKSKAVSEVKKEINKIRADIESQSQRICGDFKTSAKETSTLSINAEMSIPPKLSVNYEAKIPSLGLSWGKNKIISTTFRNVVNDVVNFDLLGDVRRSLTKKVVRSSKYSIQPLAIEPEKYFGRETSWKRPM